MVAALVDRCGKVDDTLDGAENGPRPQPLGSRSAARKRTQLNTDAPNAAVSTPSLACSSWTPRKASVATSNDTVKPIPAAVPANPTAPQPTGGRNRPRLNTDSSHEPPRIPIGLPTTYPIAIPSVIGEVYAVARKLPLITIPVFDNANSGTIT